MVAKELFTIAYCATEGSKYFMRVTQANGQITNIDLTHQDPARVINSLVTAINQAIDPVGPVVNKIPF